jgi:hypothetical protein
VLHSLNTFKNVKEAILGKTSFSGYQNDPAGCEGYTFVIRKMAALGTVGQLGEVNVNPLSVPASIGSAYNKSSIISE